MNYFRASATMSDIYEVSYQQDISGDLRVRSTIGKSCNDICLGVINGYLITCENKKEFFSEDDLLLIFGNLKEIVVFQESFLQSLELAYEQEQSVERIGTGPELTRIENNVFFWSRIFNPK